LYCYLDLDDSCDIYFFSPICGICNDEFFQTSKKC
jgi:hypothetical protein